MAYATSFKILSPPGPQSLTGSVQAIDATSTTQHYKLGTVVKAIDPVFGVSEFVYCVGVVGTLVGEPIQINGDFTTTRATGGTATGRLGVAMSINVASQYGWYCILGRCFGVIAGDMATVSGSNQASIVANVWSTAVTATKIVGRAICCTGLVAGGSAIAGTSELTPAGYAELLIFYPDATLAV